MAAGDAAEAGGIGELVEHQRLVPGLVQDQARHGRADEARAAVIMIRIRTIPLSACRIQARPAARTRGGRPRSFSETRACAPSKARGWRAPDRSRGCRARGPANNRRRPCRGPRCRERACNSRARTPRARRPGGLLRVQRHGCVAAEARRAAADVDDDVEHAAPRHAHELGLGEGRKLEMQAAHRARMAREHVIVLHEVAIDPSPAKTPRL